MGIEENPFTPQGVGAVLFSVDEVDPTLDEMVQLAAFYQHFVREGRKVAPLMAGLPHNISSFCSTTRPCRFSPALETQGA